MEAAVTVRGMDEHGLQVFNGFFPEAHHEKFPNQKAGHVVKKATSLNIEEEKRPSGRDLKGKNGPDRRRIPPTGGTESGEVVSAQENLAPLDHPTHIKVHVPQKAPVMPKEDWRICAHKDHVHVSLPEGALSRMEIGKDVKEGNGSEVSGKISAQDTEEDVGR